jgi:hypothetical protein
MGINTRTRYLTEASLHTGTLLNPEKCPKEARNGQHRLHQQRIKVLLSTIKQCSAGMPQITKHYYNLWLKDNRRILSITVIYAIT